MEWSVTFLDELQRMKKRMDEAWSDLFEEDPAKEKEVGGWVEKLPKFEGPGRRCSRSRSNKRIKPF
jgi:hypothetical protein